MSKKLWKKDKNEQRLARRRKVSEKYDYQQYVEWHYEQKRLHQEWWIRLQAQMLGVGVYPFVPFS